MVEQRDVQRQMTEHNTKTPQEKRIEFRMGINVGDVIIDGDDICGEELGCQSERY